MSEWTTITDRVCGLCHACTSNELIAAECTYYTDRTCTALNTCASTEYEYDAPVERHDVTGRFVGMQTDRVCMPLTACESDESNNIVSYEFTAPTLHATGVGAMYITDRVCAVEGNCYPAMWVSLNFQGASRNSMALVNNFRGSKCWVKWWMHDDGIWDARPLHSISN